LLCDSIPAGLEDDLIEISQFFPHPHKRSVNQYAEQDLIESKAEYFEEVELNSWQ
jgi:hypothetical protein